MRTVSLQQVISDVLKAAIGVLLFIGVANWGGVLEEIVANIPDLSAAIMVIVSFVVWTVNYFTKNKEEVEAGKFLIASRAVSEINIHNLNDLPLAISEAETRTLVRTILLTVVSIAGFAGLTTLLPFMQELLAQFDSLWAAGSTMVTFALYLYDKIKNGSTAVIEGVGEVLSMEYKSLTKAKSESYGGLLGFAKHKAA